MAQLAEILKAIDRVCVVGGNPQVCGVAEAAMAMARARDPEDAGDAEGRPQRARRTQESLSGMGLRVSEALAFERLERELAPLGIRGPMPGPAWIQRLVMGGVAGGTAVATPAVIGGMRRHMRGRPGAMHVNMSQRLAALMSQAGARKLRRYGSRKSGAEGAGG